MRGMRPKVESVRALVRTGHVVVFGEGENETEHYIVNRATGEYNAVCDDGQNYLMRLYVAPPNAQQPFAGQVAAR